MGKLEVSFQGVKFDYIQKRHGGEKNTLVCLFSNKVLFGKPTSNIHRRENLPWERAWIYFYAIANLMALVLKTTLDPIAVRYVTFPLHRIQIERHVWIDKLEKLYSFAAQMFPFCVIVYKLT